MIKRRRADDVATGGLTPAVIALLLAGWSSDRLLPDDDDFSIFDLSERDLAGLWDQHAAWLRTEARRLDVRRAWDVGGQPYFFGESLAVRLRSGRL